MEQDPSKPETNPDGDQFLGELLTDAVPGEGDSLNPPTDLDPGEGQPPDKVEGEPKLEDKKPDIEAKPEPGPDVEPKLATEPTATKTWEYKGKQYTLDQMVELGVLDDVIQTARQFPTIQTKYQTLLEGKAAPGAAAPAGDQPPAPQAPSGDQILQAYTPVMQDMADKGYIEPEAYEVFPKLVSALMYHRDLLYDVRNAVSAMIQSENSRSEVSQNEQAKTYVNGLCDKVSGEGEHFALLKDEKVRKDFYEYLGTLNVLIKQVDDNFIRKQWVAYNSDPMLEAVRLAASEQKGTEAKTRRNAKGEGGGVRPAPAKAVPASADQELIESFLG